MSLSTASGAATTVAFATADGTATTADNDYRAASGTLTFQPGQTRKTITVLVDGDTVYENNETFKVNLSNPNAATIPAGKGIGVGTIVNDDSPPRLSIGNVNVQESPTGTTAVFVVTLTGSTELPATVNYSTTSGTAKAGRDYVAAAGTLRFAPGVVTQTISVKVLSDSLLKSNETFYVNLSGAKQAAVTGNGRGTCTIQDHALTALMDALAAAESPAAKTPTAGPAVDQAIRLLLPRTSS